ncbi:acyl-CoA/acyl-ACP dehydrogenase [Xenophilus arseniciresistens]|uniref:Acyl-CoA/acyl-ACP dehydrogenase n=1 Tax=Xenophilus arseniciresistens TaxID=1283306 RepID=A0AAE3NCA5_9BURK|nr:acyl-CoA dehydrogenase family protein [Xenophilus arseniciresistens]MDA7416939.1 acyl-CoA/acyl-ACP dehydrogenase [Xenophilus arseniciresistens]
MQTALNEEQQLIQASALDWLRERYDLRQREAGLHRDGGNAQAWQAFADMGWLGLPLPQDCGGLEAGLLECGLLAQALGRHLVVEPWLGCVMQAARLLARAGDAAQHARWLPGVVDGSHRLALAHRERGEQRQTRLLADGDGGWRLHGAKLAVAGAAGAVRWIVPAVDAQGATRLCLVDPQASGVHCDAYDSTDGGRAADLRFEGVAVAAADLLDAAEAGATLQRSLAEAQLMALWQGTGTMQAALAQTVAHVQQRRQFGQPLAQFQSVQHRLAEMAVQCAEAQAACELATLRLAADGGSADAAWCAAHMAGSKVLRAAREVAQGTVQLHGAMGVCEELAIAPGFRTLLALEAELGGTAAQGTALGRLLLADGGFATSATLGHPEETLA